MIISSYLLPTSAFLLLIFYFSLKLHNKNNNKKCKSAPEPSGAWPIIGHLRILGGQTPVHRVFASLSDKYGPIFIVRVGMYKTVVISDREGVKECFTTKDKVLEKRPVSTHGVYIGYNYAGIGFAHGPYWRLVRKLIVQEMLCGKKLEMMRNVRESEVHASIQELYGAMMTVKDNKDKVDISQWFDQLTLNMIMLTLNGRRYTGTTSDEGSAGGRSLREVLKEFMSISGQFVVSDAIPIFPLTWIDSQGQIKTIKRISEELGAICERWIDEHIAEGQKAENNQDFIDTMLATIDDTLMGFGHKRDTIIKATVSSLILAGSDTTSIHMTWLLSLLLNNERVLKKARNEIDEKVGKERWVQESDISSLTYLQAIVKETLRLYPPGPLALPHEATEDCSISGYHVPKGTRVMVNIWKLHRDPSMWSEPDKFMPERFLASHVDVNFSGQHHEFIPFGSGRRSCPGTSFAMQVTCLTIARLLQGFDVKTPLNMPVDMEEAMGITLQKVKPLEVIIKSRFPDAFYQT